MSGRPSGFSQEIAGTICERLSLGESLRSICRDESMPSQSMVFRWLASNVDFREQYAHAREVQADSWADDIIEIADDSSGDVIRDPESGNERFNSEYAARSRLRVDTRKWLMARMAPKKYGDRITQEVDHKSSDGSMTPQRIELVALKPNDNGSNSPPA